MIGLYLLMVSALPLPRAASLSWGFFPPSQPLCPLPSQLSGHDLNWLRPHSTPPPVGFHHPGCLFTKAVGRHNSLSFWDSCSLFCSISEWPQGPQHKSQDSPEEQSGWFTVETEQDSFLGCTEQEPSSEHQGGISPGRHAPCLHGGHRQGMES